MSPAWAAQCLPSRMNHLGWEKCRGRRDKFKRPPKLMAASQEIRCVLQLFLDTSSTTSEST